MGLSVTVTPVGAMVLKPWIWIRTGPKQSGDSMEPSVPGLFTWLQFSPVIPKGIPAFGIYGEDVQEAGDESVPADVGETAQLARAGLAVAYMRGKAYLSMGVLPWGLRIGGGLLLLGEIAGHAGGSDRYDRVWAE